MIMIMNMIMIMIMIVIIIYIASWNSLEFPGVKCFSLMRTGISNHLLVCNNWDRDPKWIVLA